MILNITSSKKQIYKKNLAREKDWSAHIKRWSRKSSRVLTLLVIPLVFLFAGCSLVKPTIVGEERDSGPEQPVSVAHIPDAVPREEIRTIAGNKTPYRLLGKTYHIMSSPEGYRQHGTASWYGKKFHGRRTSNGELYNMYGMTAAHKTLPIPCYVRVTNTQNNRTVIVRVNDRGPFHGNRIIDLTYTAAKKLGFENTGTAPVLVEYVDPKSHQATIPAPANAGLQANPNEPLAPAPGNPAGYQLPQNTFLQVGAFSRATTAYQVQDKLKGLTHFKVWVLEPKQKSSLFRVQIGPFADNFELMNVRQKLIDANFTTPHVVYR